MNREGISYLCVVLGVCVRGGGDVLDSSVRWSHFSVGTVGQRCICAT